MTGDYFTPPGVALDARQGSYCSRKVVKTLCSSENDVVRFSIVCLWREWMKHKMAYCLELNSTLFIPRDISLRWTMAFLILYCSLSFFCGLLRLSFYVGCND